MSPNKIDVNEGRKLTELEGLCNEVGLLTKLKVVKSPYWSSESYGFGLHISRYGFYPYFFPLCIVTDHAPRYFVGGFLDRELSSKVPVQFYHSPENVELWNEKYVKPAYCLYSPFVFYRRSNKIERLKSAEGTVVFPAHSTSDIDDAGGYGMYIKTLKELPEKYHPLKICLHMHDIRKGLHLDFIREGFDVVTAGNSRDQRFTERFYEIVRQSKYATSNTPGSYLFYCIEMGIPFFISGPKPKWVRKDARTGDSTPYNPYENSVHKQVYDMFVCEYVKDDPVIKPEQADFVNRNLGLYAGISRLRMAWVLYSSLLKYVFSYHGFIHVARNNIVVRYLVPFLRK